MRKSVEKVTLTVNDKTIEAPKGQSLLKACLDNDVYIPHYCYHPGIAIDGNCRMCLVEMEGARGPVPACATYCAQDMKIQSETEKIHGLREQVLEFYLANHPLDCPFCDKGGECPLQNYTMDYHKGGSRLTVPKNHGQKHHELGEHIVFDSERCINCTRCVRYYRDVLGDEQLGVKSRGSHTQISTFDDRPLTHDHSGNITDFCPVGALTTKEYRFAARPWELKAIPTSCAGCSVGCPTVAWRRNNVHDVLRFTAAQDEDAGYFWLCDEGRFYPNRVADQGRLLFPMTSAQQEIGWAEASQQVHEKLAGGAPKILASPQWTRRELSEIKSAWGDDSLLSPLPKAQLEFLKAALDAGWISDVTTVLNESDVMIEKVDDPDSWIGSVYRLRLRSAQRERQRPWLASKAAKYHKDMGVTVDAKKTPAQFLDENEGAEDVIVVISESQMTADGLAKIKALAEKVKSAGGRLAVAPLCSAANALDQAGLGLASYESQSLSGNLIIGLAEEMGPAVWNKIKSDKPGWKAAMSVQPPETAHSLGVDLWLPTATFYEKRGSFTGLTGEKRVLAQTAQPPLEVPLLIEWIEFIRDPANGYREKSDDQHQGHSATT